MANFAELDENNVVLRVVAVSNDLIIDENSVEQENIGIGYLRALLGGVWKQTSFNTRHIYEYEYDDSVPPKVISATIVGSEHTQGGTPFRGTYAGIGFTYDAVTDTFTPPPPPEVNDETDL